jgi:hypothetical protein
MIDLLVLDSLGKLIFQIENNEFPLLQNKLS